MAEALPLRDLDLLAATVATADQELLVVVEVDFEAERDQRLPLHGLVQLHVGHLGVVGVPQEVFEGGAELGCGGRVLGHPVPPVEDLLLLLVALEVVQGRDQAGERVEPLGLVDVAPLPVAQLVGQAAGASWYVAIPCPHRESRLRPRDRGPFGPTEP